ncbi:hypothetical protein QA597_11980, partial [Marinilabiliaceae bacterium ANBcel2]|nr:hypothetical protein [Marinilabiliaceae bacterium ANBcel2]
EEIGYRNAYTGVAQGGGGNHAQTLFLLGLGLTVDGAQGGARIFQGSNEGVRAAAVRNNIPTAEIDRIMRNTNNFATGAKWVGRGVIVVGAGISISQGYDAYSQGDMAGVTKAGLDFGAGIGAAAIGGIPGVLLYGGYMIIMQPLPGGLTHYISPLAAPDKTYVAPPIIPRF